jgi:GNAT superfamily N-acetyltransferase
MAIAAITVCDRPYSGSPADDDLIRALLAESYAHLGRVHAWTPARFDSLRHGHYWREERDGDYSWLADFHLWTTPDGELVGAVHPGDDGHGDVVLAVHPGFREIETAMLAWAEDHWRVNRAAARIQLEVVDWDTPRLELLRERGWRSDGPCWLHRTRALGDLRPVPVLPDGYHIRQLNEADPRDQRLHLAMINAVFGRAITLDTMPFIARRPTPHEYWAVECPDGELAAWCGIWFDLRNSVAEFEPVGTHPEHRRKGLARAIMQHGLRRMEARGMRTAFVAPWHDADANALYEAVGLEIAARLDTWVKQLTT